LLGDPEEARRAFIEANNAGVNMVDIAPSYGEAEGEARGPDIEV